MSESAILKDSTNRLIVEFADHLESVKPLNKRLLNLIECLILTICNVEGGLTT